MLLVVALDVDAVGEIFDCDEALSVEDDAIEGECELLLPVCVDVAVCCVDNIIVADVEAVWTAVLLVVAVCGEMADDVISSDRVDALLSQISIVRAVAIGRVSGVDITVFSVCSSSLIEFFYSGFLLIFFLKISF